nr:J domain-containing protein [Sphingomonas jejuensis]
MLLLGLLVLAVLAWLGRSKRPAMTLAEARRTLELGGGASADDVRSAHRRIIARVHPDAGGSAELAGRANAARDTLLAEIERRSRS